MSAFHLCSQEEIDRKNKQKSKRVKTLFKKAQELQNDIGCEVFIYIKDQYNHVKFGGSPGLAKKFKEGTLSLEAAKKKEVPLYVVTPQKTNARHLKSIWPGNTCNSENLESKQENQLPVAIQKNGAEAHKIHSEGLQKASGDPAGPVQVCKESDGTTENWVTLPEKEVTKEDTETSEETEEIPKEDEDEDEPLSILKKVVGGEADEIDENAETVYTVAQVRKKRVFEGKVQYLVKWKGWGEKYNSWEPEDHILDKRLIDDFNTRSKKQKC